MTDLFFFQVSHSQRLREAPLKVWVLVEPDGAIVTAHCPCMAGAEETCPQIGATLFVVEMAVRLRDSQVCTDKKNMWLPAHSSGAGNKELQTFIIKEKEAAHRQ